MARQLSQFTIDRSDDAYLLRIETDDGETIEIGASYDQLDLISEAIDEQLDSDEDDVLEVADAEAE